MTQSVETAGPEVVDDDTRPAETISTTVAEYSPLIEGLARMRHELKDRAFDLTTTRGDKEARQARQQLVRTRTALAGRRDDLKRELRSSVAQRLALLDAEAERLIGFVREFETPLDEMITADESRRAREKAEREAAEAERVAVLRDRVNAIADVAVRAASLGSQDIDAKLAMVAKIVINSGFEEFQSIAVTTQAQTIVRLQELRAAAVQREEQAAQVEAARLRLEQLERESAERLAREAEEQKLRKVAAEARDAQRQAADALMTEIDRICRRARNASSAGLLELVTLIENVRVGQELGEFAQDVERTRVLALADLHEIHKIMIDREAEQRATAAEAQRVRDEQAREQQRIDAAAADLARRQAEADERDRIAAEHERARVAALQPVAQQNARGDQAEGLLPAAAGACANPKAEAAQASGSGDEGSGAHAEERAPPPDLTAEQELLAAAIGVVMTAKATGARHRTPGPWIVPPAEMAALKSAVRKQPGVSHFFGSENGASLMTSTND